QEGLQEGRIEGERRLLLRQIEHRFGELPSVAIASIQALSLQNLERLGEAMWGFNTTEDLLNWLQQYSS
ncbi:MAG TPA: transposase, partial [Cyanobacteria bacterium UBA11162]|nr:transposase [Cyanobacteria bacterium UBA11162]